MKFDPPDQLDAMFNPRSIAVVGASEKIGKWGFRVINSLITWGSNVEIYPVNPNRSEVIGLKAYNNLTEISGAVDLAVVAVPASLVPEIMEDCGEKGVKLAIIITAGFGETGENGRQLEEEIVEIANRGGTRIVGPNCMGHFNSHNNMCTASFVQKVEKGKISVISQSGNFGAYIINVGASEGFGFSKYISAGNEADLHFEDYLEYLAQDPDTEIIVGYIEELREGRRFLDLASEISKEKPILVMKAGRTRAGSKAAKSHTGAMAGEDSVYDSIFRQAGVIRVEDRRELLDTLKAIQLQPMPKGKRVGILTGGGGFGVITADACEKYGLDVPELSEKTMEELDNVLPPRWSHGNPVDMVTGGFQTYECLPLLLKEENVDIVIAVYSLGITMLGRRFDVVPGKKEASKKIREKSKEMEKSAVKDVISLAKEQGKPIICAGVSVDSQDGPLKGTIGGAIPTYPSPGRTARVLRNLVRYKSYLDEKS